MTATTIETFLASGESEILEFKKNFGKETIITLSALANTMGGWVLLGVDDEGKVVGFKGGRESETSA